MEVPFVTRISVAPARMRQGVTLAELMVSIAVLVVLLGIAFPALLGARIASLEAAELAHQRQVGNVILHYTGDHHGRLPYYGIPGTDEALLQWNGLSWSGANWYWSQPLLWHLHAQNLGYDEASMTMTGPALGYEFDPIYANISVSPYARDALDILTYTVFARPSFWRADSAQLVDDHHPQTIESVAHPSAKGILLRRNWAREPDPDPLEASYANAPALLWFADGHGAFHRMADLMPGVPMYGLLVGDPIPVLMTQDGVLGRDVGRQ